jgi:hypothetical protein
MKSSDILLSLGEPLTVSRDINGKVCVHYDGGYIKDECFLIGTTGRGEDFESACDDYLAKIRGKTLVIYRSSVGLGKKEVTVLG